LKSLILGDIFYWSNIKHIPDTINLLIKLEKLEAHRGDLKSLGLSFGELTNLKYLRMTHCNIHSLKFSFDKLNNLQKLILAANAIRELPASIGNAHSLKYLDISKNPIAHLPEQLSSLTNLEWLYIFETNITERETKKLNHFLPNTQITDPIAPYPDMTVEAQRAVLNYWFGDKRPPGFKWLDRIRK
jgi:Leucine-rich repeat (LRR) protein